MFGEALQALTPNIEGASQAAGAGEVAETRLNILNEGARQAVGAAEVAENTFMLF